MPPPLLLGLLLTTFAISCGGQAETVAPTGCTSAKECGDADPCTRDVCMSRICIHNQIAGCSFGVYRARDAGVTEATR